MCIRDSGCCSKTADKCKYSHQLDIAQRQQKRSVFEVPDEDSIEMWDQKKLEAVIARKHGQEVNSNNETTIVCKHFLDAVEKKLYGWFWHCPGGKDCKYKHKLPPGYVFKSELRERMLAELAARKTDQDILRENLIPLKKKGSLTPMTLDVYLKWKQERVDKMKAEAEAKKKAEEAKKKGVVGKKPEKKVFAPVAFVRAIRDALERYHAEWGETHDLATNFEQRHDAEKVVDRLRPAVFEEVRVETDAEMREVARDEVGVLKVDVVEPQRRDDGVHDVLRADEIGRQAVVGLEDGQRRHRSAAHGCRRVLQSLSLIHI